MVDLWVISAIAFGAGLIQGLSGFGSGLLAVPLLSLLLPVETVVPLLALLGFSLSVYNLWHLRRAVQLRPVWPLLGGYLLGTPLGLLLLKGLPQPLWMTALGAFLVLYSLFSLGGYRTDFPWLREQRLGLGIASGLLGTAFSTNGPPIILHVAAHGEWDADRQKAILSVFFSLSGGITLLAHGSLGLITEEVLHWFLWMLPLLMLGAQTGVFLYRRMGQDDYRKLTFFLILMTGLLLTVR